MQKLFYSALVCAGFALCACTPEAEIGSGGLLDLVSGISNTPAVRDIQAGTANNIVPAHDAAATSDVLSFSGTVSGTGEFDLFELGPAAAGDQWSVGFDGAAPSGWFVVAFFDEHQELLRRQPLSATQPLEHVWRAETGQVYLGIAALYGSNAGAYQLRGLRQRGRAVPAPRRQVVWLNFAGAAGVSVHGRSPVSIPPFDAASLGKAYVGATQEVKAEILAAMRADYARFDVSIGSSDEGPPPDDAVEILHFGGNDNRLLGLADSVDRYNAVVGQKAVVYTDAFANYSVMLLSVDEMSQMIANTGSHELGHLLGLFHTAAPTDIMDTTADAWQLTENQSFSTGKLDASVFPWGFENSPQRLAETVGYNPTPAPAEGPPKPTGVQKLYRKAALRALVHTDLRTRCGTCLDPDGTE